MYFINIYANYYNPSFPIKLCIILMFMINLNIILIIISFIINIQLSLLNINHLYFIPLSIITLNQFL